MSEREMQALIRLLERQLGLEWSDIVEWLRDQNPVEAIEARLIERGVAGGLIEEVASAAARFADKIHDSYIHAGKETTAWLDLKVPDKLIRFDQTNFRAVARAQENDYRLVRGMDNEQRNVLSRVVSEGLEAGANPRVMARDIRDSIGLTDKQSQFVQNYRRALEDQDWSNALGRENRDKRSDKLIRRMRREGESLTPAQIDSLVERYRQGWVSYRAETIARTEGLRAAHEGHDEALEQAIERGDIEADQLEEEWCSGPNTKHARDQHQAMDGERVPFGTDFVMPDGTRMRGPGDVRGGAKHNAGCRCCKATRYKEPEQAAA